MSADDWDDDQHARRPTDDEPAPRPRRRRPDEEYDDRPRRRPPPGVEATDFLIPTGVSAWSMAACYFGLFSCFIPVLGLLMALIALPCGIVALRRRKKGGATYGAVTGDIRAILGIACSSVTLIGYVAIVVLILANAK